MFVPGSSQVSNAQSSYQIANSLRFQRASSQYLTRTPSVAGNQKIWTWSAWVKRGNLSYATAQLFNGYDTGNNRHIIYFEGTDQLYFQELIGGATQFNLYTSAVFRDPSAWYHIVVAWDTTQATASNRVKIWVNNVQQTLNGSYPSLNFDGYINGTQGHTIGKLVSEYFDGYMTEINFVNAQALTPSSFGATNLLTGQWQAKKYTGTYGTNGFYLPFSNGTSTTTLGADSSGNGNNWTLTNFTRSAGYTDCWMVDVPSGNGGATATQPSANYCTLNPIYYNSYSGNTLATNLQINSPTTDGFIPGTITVSSGKWYYEASMLNSTAAAFVLGIVKSTINSTSTELRNVGTGNGYSYLSSTGVKSDGSGGAGTAYGATFTTGDVIGVAFDLDSGSITFYKNNVSQGVAYSGFSGTFMPAIGDAAGGSGGQTAWVNFGQRSFAYTPPSGYKALCTANLPDSAIPAGNKYMDATTWTSTGTTQTVTNAGGFKPDLVWNKVRNIVSDNWLVDSVRGTSLYLSSDLTNAEVTNTGFVTSFNSNGFSLGTSQYSNTNTVVSWQWQAGAGVSATNTDGTLASVVSVNKSAGFSIATFTGAASGVQTVGHGLGVAPKMVILKSRNVVSDWSVYHEGIGNTKYIFLNTNAAAVTNSIWWNNTSPTSSVFTLGTAFNGFGNTVAYCFAEIAGFSKFGSYTGNGSADGAFIYTGFRPKFVMIKNYGLADNWCMYDTSRNAYNVTNLFLTAQASTAEQTGLEIDILSNGFKARTTNDNVNSSSYSYIYMAFAENPFKNANAR